MKLFCSYHEKALCVLGYFSWLPPLLARLTIGAIFIESGWGKLHNLAKVIAFFESIGIPAAQLQAPFVAGTEFLAGILVLIGLCTRIASVPLTVIMFMAIATAKRGDLHEWTDLFGMSEFLYIVLLLWLIVAGAGAVSIDGRCNSKCKTKSSH